ncbi:MAG: hypothetical protein A3D92_18210 [Bacteroidetes bacterium RIFCSPHIGHO2_02_FULL_44_7]|nr:MAG: hypothetical protein A3D92_18210 [Bacteroidetes bacterium RIFCSPHIGHO2_02_FULL_44_7]
MKKQRVAIFASGAGSNALNLIAYFEKHAQIEIAFVLSNKADAGIVASARALGVPTFVCSNEEAARADYLHALCNHHRIDWIVLAGYLRLIPAAFIDKYERKMINLHPSLLPNYGGQGMYGRKVHAAVLAANEKFTGITVHFVNAQFDKGEIIAQFHTPIQPGASIEDVEASIRHLEHSYLPVGWVCETVQ